MAIQDLFSAEELARLRGFPEINRAELSRYCTLTSADKAFVRQFRPGRNALGVAVQLCTLPWLGFVPDEVAAAPATPAGPWPVAAPSPVTGVVEVSRRFNAPGRRGSGARSRRAPGIARR